MPLDIEHRMQALHQVMNMEGWEILRDHLTTIREGDIISLSAPKRELPDDFYRGRIAALTWFLDSLPEEVAGYFREKQAQAGAGQPSESLGHPYGPEQEGQPFLEGEDLR